MLKFGFFLSNVQAGLWLSMGDVTKNDYTSEIIGHRSFFRWLFEPIRAIGVMDTKNWWQCLVLFSPFPNWIQNDVAAQMTDKKNPNLHNYWVENGRGNCKQFEPEVKAPFIRWSEIAKILSFWGHSLAASHSSQPRDCRWNERTDFAGTYREHFSWGVE